MVAPPSEHEILDVNRRYHDVAADTYDAKWGISFGEIGHQQVLGKLTKLLGPKPGPFARSLEIGAGTGYFSLNLLQTGVIGEATCTDISPGMLATLEHNARPRRVLRRVHARAQARRDAVLRRRAEPLRRHARRLSQARRGPGRAAVAPSDQGAPRARPPRRP